MAMKLKGEFNYWWPADLQVMGKDIVRFHAVYWPAFLMAAGLALPKRLLVHGWFKVNQQKMSKSFGNVVDPLALYEAYGADAVRYYIVRHMAITHDSEFGTGDLEQRISSELANDLGNLLNRMVMLADKHQLYEVKAPANWSAKEIELRDAFWDMLEFFIIDMEEGYYYRALNALWKYINEVNAYFHAQEPWKIADKERFNEVMAATCHSLYAVGTLLHPVMPSKMATMLNSLGVSAEFKGDMVAELSENPWNKTFMLSKIPMLFQKYETEKQGQVTSPQVPSERPAARQTQDQLPAITIEDFAKVALVVGTIERCEEIAGSDKLLKLQVNFGEHGMRQVLSGVKKSFAPEDLLNKQAVFVFNLAPRKMMGLESHGMMLTAQGVDEKLTLITAANLIPNGARLK